MSVDELTHVMESEEPGRPRRALVVLLTLGLIGAIIAVFLVTQSDKRALAELRIRDERVSVKPTEADFEPGVEGQALVVGDTVRTNSEGQAQIDYFEGSQTRMDAKTTLVIGALLNEAGSRSVSIDQKRGQLWHRVERLTSSEDRYEVRTPNAVASVRGTTFATIGLYAPRWFYLGFDGETILQTSKGEQVSLLEGDCVTISENGNIRRCTKKELEKLMKGWVLTQLAYDGQLDSGPSPSPSPSASPSASPTEIRRSTGGGGGGGPPAATTPTPRGRKPSLNTPGPDGGADEQTEEPSAEPSEEPSSTPEETPCETDCPGEGSL